MAHPFLDPPDEIDRRLEALHEELLADHPLPAGTANAELSGAAQCLKLLERVRKQSDPRDSDWLFGAAAGGSAGEESTGDDLPEASPLHAYACLPPRQIGRFRIERRLGEGGFGIVFLALDPSSNRRVALKLPRPEAMVSSTSRERFLREAEAVALLDHAGIVPVFEVGRAGSLYYIVQAWCEGVSLDHWLAARGKPLAPVPAARLLQTLAETVQHAHSRGVLHRDIKPSNVLLKADHESGGDTLAEEQLAAAARLTDFGLARLVDQGARLTCSGSVLGTPAYMAPEQAEGLTRQIGVASDVYSLGAVLFELLTGRPPFQEATLLATLQAVREREPPRLRPLKPDVPVDLEAICLKCLEKDPRRRYATARELADDLARYLQGRAIEARQSGPLERLGRWWRRNPLLAGLAAAIGLLVTSLLVGSIAATVMLSQERQNTLDHLEDTILARDRATKNEALALRALYEARLAQAQAQRRSGHLGQRVGTLKAVAAAAGLLKRLGLGEAQELQLRNEAVAGMALVDLTLDKDWTSLALQHRRVATDSSVTFCAHGDADWKSILVRRLEDGAIVRRLGIAGDVVQVLNITFSPDGKYLAAWCVPRQRQGPFSVQVWALDGAAVSQQQALADTPPVAQLPAMAGTQHWPLDFSSDGKWLAIARQDGAVGLVALPGFEQHAAFPGKAFEALRFDPASRCLAVARRGKVELVDIQSGEILRGIPCGSFVFHLEFSPDGELLAAGCQDALVRLWNVSNGRLHGELAGHGAQVTRVSFHRNGRLIASTGYDHTTRLWDVFRVRQLLQADARLTGFSRDGLWLGAGGARFAVVLPDEYEVFDVPRVPECKTTGAQRLSFEPSGRYLAVSNSEQLVLFDVPNSRVVDRRRMPGGWAGFDPTGKWLIGAAHDGLYRFPVQGDGPGQSIQIDYNKPQRLAPATPGYSAASRDGTVLALVDRVYHPKIILHNTLLGITRDLQPHHRGARWLSVSPDGRWLATGAWHAVNVTIWDTLTGKVQTTLPAGNARVRFSPDGRQLAVNESPHFSVWRVSDWTPLHSQRQKTAAAVPGPIAYSPDSRWLAVLDAPCKIRVFDSSSLDEVATFKLDSDLFIDALVFDPQGTRLIAGTTTPGSLHIWNLSAIAERLDASGLGWQYARPPQDSPSAPRR